MAETKIKEPIAVQMYHKVREKEYTVIVPGLLWSHDEVIRRDRVSDEIILSITSVSQPDKIIYNGKEVRLVEV